MMPYGFGFALFAQNGPVFPDWLANSASPIVGTIFAVWVGYFLITTLIPRLFDAHAKERKEADDRCRAERVEESEERKRQEERHREDRLLFIAELEGQRRIRQEEKSLLQTSLQRLETALENLRTEMRTTGLILRQTGAVAKEASEVIRDVKPVLQNAAESGINRPPVKEQA